MKHLLHTLRGIAKDRPFFAVFLVCYIAAGLYVSFGHFHHVRLGDLAGINYQALFEMNAFPFRLLNALLLAQPVWCLYNDVDMKGQWPSVATYTRRYALSVILALGTACLVFFLRQIPEIVSDHSIILALTCWTGVLLFLSLLNTLKE